MLENQCWLARLPGWYRHDADTAKYYGLRTLTVIKSQHHPSKQDNRFSSRNLE